MKNLGYNAVSTGPPLLLACTLLPNVQRRIILHFVPTACLRAATMLRALPGQLARVQASPGASSRAGSNFQDELLQEIRSLRNDDESKAFVVTEKILRWTDSNDLSESFRMCNALLDAFDTPFLCRALIKLAGNEELAGKVLNASRLLILKSVDFENSLLSTGLLAKIVETMNEHAQDREVQKYGSGVLSWVAREHAPYLVGDLSAHETIIAAMSSFPEDYEFLLVCSTTINQSLSYGPSKGKLREAGAFKAFCTMVHYHGDDDDIEAQAEIFFEKMFSKSS